MGIEDLLGKASGTDLRKVFSLADQLWDDRDKITEVVGLVWENRDQFSAALDFVQEHGDELVDLLKRLPELLSTAGEALDAAGAGAETASVFLIGAPIGQGKTGKTGPPAVAVTTLTETAADALDRCQNELHGVESMISGLGRQVDALGILPKSIRDIGGGAHRIALVADDLATVADQLRHLGVSVNDAGADLGKVGEMLQYSGSALQSLTGGSPSKSSSRKPVAKKAATKTTPPKNARSKKGPKVKSPSKKTSSKKTATARKRSGSGPKAGLKAKPSTRKK